MPVTDTASVALSLELLVRRILEEVLTTFKFHKP